MGHNPPLSKEEKNFVAMMNDIFDRQTKEAMKNVPKVMKGEEIEMFDSKRWIFEVAQLTTDLRFRPFKRGGDLAVAELFRMQKTFGVAEWIEAPEVLEALNQENFEFARRINDTTANDLRAALSEGMKAGETVSQIKKRVEGVNANWKKGKRSMMIARTETARASTQGQIQAWKQSGIVTEKKWSAAGDACPFCAEMNGKIISIESSFFGEGDSLSADVGGGRTGTMKMGYGEVSGPPLHPNCRCSIVANIQTAGGIPIGAEVVKPSKPVAPTATSPAMEKLILEEYRTSGWEKSKDMGEIRSQFKKYGISVITPIFEHEEISSLSVKAMNDIGEELALMKQRFPSFFKQVQKREFRLRGTEGLVLEEGRKNAGTFNSLLGDMQLSFSKTNTPKNLGSKLTLGSDKWSSVGVRGWRGVFRHEYGHVVDQASAASLYNVPIRKALEEQGIIFGTETGKREIKSIIGNYAATNSEEFAAEVFMIWTDPRYELGQLPQWLEKVLSKAIGEMI